MRGELEAPGFSVAVQPSSGSSATVPRRDRQPRLRKEVTSSVDRLKRWRPRAARRRRASTQRKEKVDQESHRENTVDGHHRATEGGAYPATMAMAVANIANEQNDESAPCAAELTLVDLRETVPCDSHGLVDLRETVPCDPRTALADLRKGCAV